MTCEKVLGPGATGALFCGEDCAFYTEECAPASKCGNGVIDSGEACDGQNFGGETCASVLLDPLAVGQLTCLGCAEIYAEGCSIDLCGNGVLDEGEECDDGDKNAGDGCNASCETECPSAPWKKLNGHCYARVNIPTTIEGAMASCKGGTEHLATIDSQAENDFILGLLKNDPKSSWIGLTNGSFGGDYYWTNGEPLGYTNWSQFPDTFEPLCVFMSQVTGEWATAPCGDLHPYVCEIDPPSGP
jgi:cysteine-rich repeat protein